MNAASASAVNEGLAYREQNRADESRAAERKAARAQDPLAARVDGLLNEGRVDDALRLVIDAMRRDWRNLELNERAHELYLLKGENPKTLAHGQQYLRVLLAAERGSRALDVLKRLHHLDSVFEPQVDLLLGLAKVAFEQNESHLAVALLRRFDKRFPRHPDVPGVYLLGARITSELLGQHDKAARMLEVMLRRHPNATVKADAMEYLAVLKQRMQGSVAAAA